MKSVLPLRIVLPLMLGIAASLAIAVYAELGYRRLVTGPFVVYSKEGS